jgi:PAS domain S-box-containing protein
MPRTGRRLRSTSPASPFSVDRWKTGFWRFILLPGVLLTLSTTSAWASNADRPDVGPADLQMTASDPAVPPPDRKPAERGPGNVAGLPANGVSVDRPPGIWATHRNLIVGVTFVLLVQLLTIAALLLNRRRRTAAERLLIESEERFRASLATALDDKRQYEEGLELLLKMSQQADALTIKQLHTRALEVAVKATRSRVGRLHNTGEEPDAILLYPPGAGSALADQRDERRGERRLSMAIPDGDATNMTIEVGGKDGDYNDEDRRQLTLVANMLQKILLRRRMEAALYESEARFRFITDQSPGLIWVSDENKKCTWFNRTWLDFTGHNQGQDLGDGWAGSIHADDRVGYCAVADRHFDVRLPFAAEARLRRHDGEYRWMLSLGQPRFDESGGFKGYVGTCLDMTEHKRTSEAIQQSKALLQSVIDATPDWIYVKDREHRFMLVNKQCASAFDLSPTDMVDRCDVDFVPSKLRIGSLDRGIEDLHDDDDAVFDGQSVHHASERIFFGNGEVRVFDSFKVPMRDSTQRVYGALCYRRDITEHFNKELEQQALATQLRQAQKMELIGHLTGGIAHDFNNILAAVFGYAELMQMSPVIKSNAQLELYLQEILQAGIRAKELVSQLLTFSHRREAASEAINVAPIVKEVAKLLRSTMPTSISIDCALADNLPEVLISPVQLHQVLMNLGVNARDAMARTGLVEIRAERAFLDHSTACASCHQNFSGTYLMISVRDSGSGITPENLMRIFDPFFTTKDVGRGSGLGLSVLHGIVHSANGHIKVLSVPGDGTEFRIYLPPHSKGSERLTGESKLDEEKLPVRGHIMVVDDEASIVRFMTLLLEQLGCRVTGLTSASEALAAFKADPYAVDLVLTDQTMPELSGVELARAMLACRSDIPIVLSTGYSNVIDDDTARQIGIRRFLIKPVPAKVLADIVAEYLSVPAPGADAG